MNGQTLIVTRNSLIHLVLQDALIQWAVNMLKYRFIPSLSTQFLSTVVSFLFAVVCHTLLKFNML